MYGSQNDEKILKFQIHFVGSIYLIDFLALVFQLKWNQEKQ